MPIFAEDAQCLWDLDSFLGILTVWCGDGLAELTEWRYLVPALTPRFTCCVNLLHWDSVAGLVTECRCTWNRCILKTEFQIDEIYLLPFSGILSPLVFAECRAGSLWAPQVLRTYKCFTAPHGILLSACEARFGCSFNGISILLVSGGDLHYHLSQHGVFSEKEMRFYATEIILGLEHMHNRFVVYRDLKVIVNRATAFTLVLDSSKYTHRFNYPALNLLWGRIQVICSSLADFSNNVQKSSELSCYSI